MNQKGAVHIVLMGLLLAGLVAGVYLVQQTQIFKPKAAEPNQKIDEECKKLFPKMWYWTYISSNEKACILKYGIKGTTFKSYIPIDKEIEGTGCTWSGGDIDNFITSAEECVKKNSTPKKTLEECKGRLHRIWVWSSKDGICRLLEGGLNADKTECVAVNITNSDGSNVEFSETKATCEAKNEPWPTPEYVKIGTTYNCSAVGDACEDYQVCRKYLDPEKNIDVYKCVGTPPTTTTVVATCSEGTKNVGDKWPECHGCDEGVVTCTGQDQYDFKSVKNPSGNCGWGCEVQEVYQDIVGQSSEDQPAEEQ